MMGPGKSARTPIRFSVTAGEYAVCRLGARDAMPPWAFGEGFSSITRTEKEMSIVCPVDRVPAGIRSEAGWALLQLEGPFPLDAVGVLQSVVDPLADAGIALFAISTFDTDYLLIKHADLERAAGALRVAGHTDSDLRR